jgi:hypothetical protein
MTKVRLLTALSLGTMLFASCEKQIEENPSPKATLASSASTAELPGNWELVGFTGVVPVSNSNTIQTTNIFAMLEDCKKDDKLHFESTGELTQLPGAVQCNAEFVEESEQDDSSDSGSWNLSDDKKTLTLSLGETKAYEVVALTSSTLKLRSVGAADEPYTELEYTR